MKLKKQVSRTVKTQAHNIYYPAFLNLENKKTVVVGGGKIAERKILGLLDARAEVTVVSPADYETPGAGKAEGQNSAYLPEIQKG